MNKILVKYCEGRPISLLVEEHVGFDEHGQDIVCAAVSTLAQTLIQGIYAVAKVEVFPCEIKEAYVYLERPADCDEETHVIIDIVFKTILEGLKLIRDTYPNYIEFREEEVQCRC